MTPVESPNVAPAVTGSHQPPGRDSQADQPVAQSDDVLEVEPAAGSVFDFVAGSGDSTWHEGDVYEPLGGARIEGWENVAKRVGQSDLVVDIVSVDDTTVNASENTWWHVPIEDSTVPSMTISSRVVAEVVGLVKNRQGDTDRSVVRLAPVFRAPVLPAPPNVGERITISVAGGHVTVDVPDDEWAAYVAERNFYRNQEDDHDHGVIEPPDPPFEEPNPGTITLARIPGLDVEVGHRYLLFLDGANTLSLEGTTEFV